MEILAVKEERDTQGLVTSVYNQEGERLGEIRLPVEVFGGRISEGVVQQAVRAHLAALRRGTASTKTRGEVRGGGRKPWRQKGTGRARAGSIRSPLWVGGGVVFGPHPRDFTEKLGKKARRAALLAVLSDRARSGNVLVLDKLSLREARTREMARILGKLGPEARTVLVLARRDEAVQRASRNIPRLEVELADKLHAYQVVAADRVVLTEAALGAIAKRLGVKEKETT